MLIYIVIFAFGVIMSTYIFYVGNNKMKKKRINRYIGEKCKILYKKPSEANIHIKTGIICNINKILGIIKAPYAAIAAVQPNTGPACSLLKIYGMLLKVDPFPIPVVKNNTMKLAKNGHQ